VVGFRILVVEILSPATEERTVEVLALSPQGYQVLGQYGEDEV